jgi:hypothetical protein
MAERDKSFEPITKAAVAHMKRANRSAPPELIEQSTEVWSRSFATKRKRKRAKPQAALASRALAVLYSGKIPDQATLPSPHLIRMVRKWLAENVITRSIHDSSILRAAGRKQ